jgi:4-diphosphocytidyl-2-C-methyl-D-erythritol kinase
VSASLVEKAPAKINLTLRVLGRREDGYHQLKSLVAFADLADTLSLQPGGETALEIAGPFAKACGPLADNLVLKAVGALRGRVVGLKAGHFLLEKKIPVAAGLGGGSADAAAALRLLARLNDLAPDDPRLAAAALAVGADVPVCLDPHPRIMRGIGELLSAPLYVPPLSAVLVNPRVPLATRDVFAAFTAKQANEKYLNNVPRGYDAMIEFLLQHGNDLTQAAIACAPVITDVLIALRALPAVRLVRMSGSGPTCFALFVSQGEGAAAAQRLAAERKDWWVHAAIVGET